MKTSSRFESFHTILKASIDPSSTHKKMIKSISIRVQLSMMNLNFFKYDDMQIQYGSIVNSSCARKNFYSAINAVEYKSITINNIKYTKGTFIVADIKEDFIVFGKIENIFVVDGTVHLKYTLYYSQYFENHYFAFNVLCQNTTETIDYNFLVMKTPCLLFVIEKKDFIVTKHIL